MEYVWLQACFCHIILYQCWFWRSKYLDAWVLRRAEYCYAQDLIDGYHIRPVLQRDLQDQFQISIRFVVCFVFSCEIQPEFFCNFIEMHPGNFRVQRCIVNYYSISKLAAEVWIVLKFWQCICGLDKRCFQWIWLKVHLAKVKPRPTLFERGLRAVSETFKDYCECLH